MSKYIKKFETHSDYNTYITGSDKVLPNVSYCVNENELHYNPIVVAQPLIVTYNVTNASNPTVLFYDSEDAGFPVSSIYDKIEIDDVEVDIEDLTLINSFYAYQLTNGQHTIKYTLTDPTFIGYEMDELSDVTTRAGATFLECSNIVSVEIPNTVTTIGGNAFNNCYRMTSIVIPNSVTTIGTYAFSDCDSLASITIPNSVTSIGNYVFNGCDSLASVTIGNSITSIGESVFGGCESLISVTIEATTLPTLGEYSFNSNASGRKIYVPSASVNAYKAANNWSTYASDIEAIP